MTHKHVIDAAHVARAADKLYGERGEPGRVAASIELLKSAHAASDYELAWRLSRAHFFLGQRATQNGDVQSAQAQHRDGVRIGRQAIRLQADKVEGCFWLGVNLALLANAESFPRAPLHALRARHALRRAVKIDATYHEAGPLRVLARLESRLPRLGGGGSEKARRGFEAALEIAGRNTVTRLYFAELLLEIGERDAAREQLEAIRNAEDDPTWSYETERDRKMAEAMLHEMRNAER